MADNNTATPSNPFQGVTFDTNAINALGHIDNLLGGTGHDKLNGHALDEKVYGEEGDKLLCRLGANQRCTANDRSRRHKA
jgi:hypothetical protein